MREQATFAVNVRKRVNPNNLGFPTILRVTSDDKTDNMFGTTHAHVRFKKVSYIIK